MHATAATPDAQLAPATRARPSIALEWVRQNAFRVLGLPGNAPLSAIHDADAAMRRRAKLGLSPGTPLDLDLAGPVGRTEAEVRDALARLTDPSTRLRERFLWVHDGAVVNGAGDEGLLALAAAATGVARTHDAAFFRLLAVCVHDPKVGDEKRWLQALAQWKACIDDDAYWEAQIDAELEGGFEPMAGLDEVQELRGQAASLIAEVPSSIARAALASGETAAADAALRALGGARLSDSAHEAILAPLVERLEETCAQIARTCSERIQRVHGEEAVIANLLPCNEAMARFDRQVKPALAQILRFADMDTNLGREAREAAASCLRVIGVSYTWADISDHAVSALRLAALTSEGSPLQARMQAELSELEVVAQRRHEQQYAPTDLPSWEQSKQHPLFGHTTLYYEPKHGNQIEYVDESGWAHLWYPGNRAVVRCEWRAGATHVWNRSLRPTHNQATGRTGRQWERQSIESVKRTMVDIVPGDPLQLARGTLPHLLRQHPRYGSIQEVLEGIRQIRRELPADLEDEPRQLISSVEIGGKRLAISSDLIAWGRTRIATRNVVGIRLSVPGNQPWSMPGAAVLAVGGFDRSVSIECAAGGLATQEIIQERWTRIMEGLWPAVMVPLLDRHLQLLKTGEGFLIGDLHFDAQGIHRAEGDSTLRKAWTSLFSDKGERRRRHHLDWSEVSGCQRAEGQVHLVSRRERWASLNPRDTWNAALLEPLIDYLVTKGHLWDVIKRKTAS